MEEIITYISSGARYIILNRPERRNAVNRDMYRKITKILNEDSTNNDVVVTILTGTGQYFCSGNDIVGSVNTLSSLGEVEDGVKSMVKVVEDMIEAFIKYPKILIAVVNGPAIGIGTTILPLCDIVYANETATFQIPFVTLGLCLEGTSSYMFSRILGKSKFGEMLYLGRTLSAREALESGFIARIIPQKKLDSFIEELREYGFLPVKSVILNKRLIQDTLNKHLLEANKREIEQLILCLQSEEFAEAVSKFLRKKHKL